MIHRTTPRFWDCYNALPEEIRKVADKNFRILEESPAHPSLQLKRIGELWSVRAGINYRALGIPDPEVEDTILWFWIGTHAEYDHMVVSR